MKKVKSVRAYADVKFHSQMPFTSVDVCFRDRQELEAFITALRLLLDESVPNVDLHLLDSPSTMAVSDSLATEVCFHPPGFVRDEIDLRCLAAARAHLTHLIGR